MGDVFEFLVEGTSGLAPGGVEGQCIVVGCCSRGEPGKAYYLGKRSNLSAALGIGPLVDRLRDVFAAGGQNPIVVAVPVEGSAQGYITEVKRAGYGPQAKSAGAAVASADVAVKILSGGVGGEAMVQISLDGGATYPESAAVPEDGVVAITGTGARIIFEATPEKPLMEDDVYRFQVVTATSQYKRIGPGPAIGIEGDPKAGGQLMLQVVKAGGLNVGTYKISIDGGDNFGPARTLPLDGRLTVYDLGVDLVFPEGAYQAGTIYVWEVLEPTPTMAAVMEALTVPLEVKDVEFVYVVGPSDSVDWAAAHALGEEQWNGHRPKYLKFETRLPRAGEDLNDWVTSLVRERDGFSSNYVQVISGFGELADSTGMMKLRSLAGLQAGRVLSIPVHRSIGRVRDGALGQVKLPEGWNDNIYQTLEDAGYVVPRRLAGLSGVYWGDGRTMAEVTSNFRYEEVLRTTFKAMRKARLAALLSIGDELGDPLSPEGAAGLSFLQANLETALNTMVKAMPSELAGFVVDIPLDQDFVNNGVAVEMTLIGIPIIRQIKLFGKYVYAGSTFDPRLEATHE